MGIRYDSSDVLVTTLFGNGLSGGQGRNRTADASLFRAALYQLSYLAWEGSLTEAFTFYHAALRSRYC